MLHEVCFCGWEGEMADREPVYAGDGDWGLVCPDCRHLDRLQGWPETARRGILAEAARRRENTLGPSTVARPPSARQPFEVVIQGVPAALDPLDNTAD